MTLLMGAGVGYGLLCIVAMKAFPRAMGEERSRVLSGVALMTGGLCVLSDWAASKGLLADFAPLLSIVAVVSLAISVGATLLILMRARR